MFYCCYCCFCSCICNFRSSIKDLQIPLEPVKILCLQQFPTHTHMYTFIYAVPPAKYKAANNLHMSVFMCMHETVAGTKTALALHRLLKRIAYSSITGTFQVSTSGPIFSGFCHSWLLHNLENWHTPAPFPSGARKEEKLELVTAWLTIAGAWGIRAGM